MPRSRVLRVTGSTATIPRSRVLRVTGTGTGAVAPARRSRVLRVTGAGAVAVTVAPLPDLTNVEPETALSVTAALVGGGAADTWTWRRVSGTAVGITGTGATVTINAPSDINGASSVIGVRATVGGVLSPEVTFTLTVLPQTEWWWSGAGWVPNIETWS